MDWPHKGIIWDNQQQRTTECLDGTVKNTKEWNTAAYILTKGLKVMGSRWYSCRTLKAYWRWNNKCTNKIIQYIQYILQPSLVVTSKIN